MRKTMNRFAEPNATDDYRPCNGCGVTYYISSLDDEGLCCDCQPEEEEEDEG
jgi:hypothetical protein